MVCSARLGKRWPRRFQRRVVFDQMGDQTRESRKRTVYKESMDAKDPTLLEDPPADRVVADRVRAASWLSRVGQSNRVAHWNAALDIHPGDFRHLPSGKSENNQSVGSMAPHRRSLLLGPLAPASVKPLALFVKCDRLQAIKARKRKGRRSIVAASTRPPSKVKLLDYKIGPFKSRPALFNNRADDAKTQILESIVRGFGVPGGIPAKRRHHIPGTTPRDSF